jgi:hypothetical protein
MSSIVTPTGRHSHWSDYADGIKEIWKNHSEDERWYIAVVNVTVTNGVADTAVFVALHAARASSQPAAQRRVLEGVRIVAQRIALLRARSEVHHSKQYKSGCRHSYSRRYCLNRSDNAHSLQLCLEFGTQSSSFDERDARLLVDVEHLWQD